MAERLLIFGGTFDPPHRAHTTLPPLVAEILECDRILYVPAAINPFKTDQPATPADHRLQMLKLALQGVPRAEISTIELVRAGPSYTVDTLEALRRQAGPAAKLHLLIGSDGALEFHRWKRWQRILELATPAVMVRAPLDGDTYRARLRERYPPPEADRWMGWTVDVPQMDVCATEIRRRLAGGDDLSGLVHPAVTEYIHQHGFYEH